VKKILIVALLLGSACEARHEAPARPPATAAPPPPAVDGRALATGRCTICHDESYLKQQRLTPEQWKKTVEKMKGFGAPINDDEAKALEDWLAQAYPVGKPDDAIVLAQKPR
jgi:hypothetical protein